MKKSQTSWDKGRNNELAKKKRIIKKVRDWEAEGKVGKVPSFKEKDTVTVMTLQAIGYIGHEQEKFFVKKIKKVSTRMGKKNNKSIGDKKKRKRNQWQKDRHASRTRGRRYQKALRDWIDDGKPNNKRPYFKKYDYVARKAINAVGIGGIEAETFFIKVPVEKKKRVYTPVDRKDTLPEVVENNWTLGKIVSCGRE